MQSVGLNQLKCGETLFRSSSSPLLTHHPRSVPLPLQCPRRTPPSSFPRRLHLGAKNRGRGLVPIIHSAAQDIPPSSVTGGDRWLLEPVGDGDTRHLGFRVPLPTAFELASNVITVGRLPEKADVVIPVATVSGVHARLEKKEGNLLVTDLDSTNGTYINDRRLRPGASAILPPGSCITFGDIHLAMFRVSKIENVDPISEVASSQVVDVTLEPTSNRETSG